jgi:hypothetical protein
VNLLPTITATTATYQPLLTITTTTTTTTTNQQQQQPTNQPINHPNSYEAIAHPDRRAIALLDLATATSQGLAGPASDTVLEARPWGFDIRAAAPAAGGPPARLWHGTDDDAVPVGAAQFLAEQLGLSSSSSSPRRQPHAKVMQGENHSLIRRHWRSVLAAVVDAARGVEQEGEKENHGENNGKEATERGGEGDNLGKERRTSGDGSGGGEAGGGAGSSGGQARL